MSDSENNEDLDLGFSEILSTPSSIVVKEEIIAEPATESQEVEDESSPLAKLKWIKEQLYTEDTLPTTMLTGVFDEICEDAKSLTLSQKDNSLIVETAGLLSDRLMLHDEHELASGVLEKVYRLTGIIPEKLITLLDAALKEFPDTSQLTTTQMKRQLRLLGVKREIEDQLPSKLTTNATVEEDLELATPLTPGVSKLKLVGTILICLVVISLGIYKFIFSTEEQFNISLSHDFDGFQEPTIMPPSIEPDRDLSQLAMVYYDIDKKGGSEKTDNSLIQEVKSARVVPEIKPELKRDRTQLNMDGPYESKRIEDIFGGGTRHQDSPYDDIVDDRPLGTSNRERERDRIRDVYENRRKQELRFDERRRDVDTWDKGDRYEVLINTSVMDRPSFKSKEVAELYVGDFIVVEARLGRWLRIRSVRGAPGFILAQDAEKVFD